MKKTTLALLLALSSAFTYAQFQPQSALESPRVEKPRHIQDGKGGFHKDGKRPEMKIVTTAEKNTWKDDQRVALQGKITEQYDDDDFLFQDKDGTIKIEVKDRAWRGQNVSPDTEIRIFGEVDKSDNGTVELEVHRVEIVK
ncbi:MAG: NirD/YgiW/YdeI family stress tolerance protein [Cardiobacteriaceae bacterium]|nr:NirD/YgiW/YdeI family stress tolerance protein [Cardiobacteriaceae bacterium]